MSYDLHFVKPRPGLSLLEVMEVQEEEYESGEVDPAFTVDTSAVKDSLLALGLEFEVIETEAESFELNPVDHESVPLQISIDSTFVGITMPNWDFSPEQVAGMRRYWDAVLPALAKQGLVGYDSQIYAEVSPSAFDQIILATDQNWKDLNAFVATKKPWWKFW